MYALIDANSFYASAEAVFSPEIRKRPIVVLTNNDGCICALNQEAKRLGVPKFAPYFKVKHLLAKHNVVVRSSNYELYADLSERMMQTVARFSDNQHVYSIDECFLKFTKYNSIIDNWSEYAALIRKTVWKETRIPVGVGIGLTPTLSKAANHAAKRIDGYNGIAVIENEQQRINILGQMDVSDVWGIGSRLGKKLNIMGIHSALDLANQSAKSMRQQFSVLMERMVNELNGIPCLNWDEVKAPKKEIFSTRSFGQHVTDIDSLKAALASHVTIVAKKLRRQNSVTNKLLVCAHSSHFSDTPYKRSLVVQLPVASNDTLVLLNQVSQVVQHIYQEGVPFARCGIGAIGLTPTQGRQLDIFNDLPDNPKLMSCFDAINSRYGNGTINSASANNSKKWQMRREFLSPRSTTCWRDIPKIEC